MADIVHSLWIGDTLGPLQRLAIASFLTHGHPYHLYCYGTVDGVPAGTVLRDGNEILPASAIFRYAHGEERGSVSAFSNLFRYKLLLDRGGWWVDTDVLCLRPFTFADDVVLASELTPQRRHVASAVIRLPPGHPLMRRCYDAARTADKPTLLWGEIGPRLLDRVVTELGYWPRVRDCAVFCPVPSFHWQALMTDGAGFLDETTVAVHLWHERWRRAGMDRDPRFAPTSLLTRVQQQVAAAENVSD